MEDEAAASTLFYDNGRVEKYINYRRGSIKTPKYVKEKELKPLTLSKKISLSHMLKSFKRSLK